jgi:hypothetical protein
MLAFEYSGLHSLAPGACCAAVRIFSLRSQRTESNLFMTRDLLLSAVAMVWLVSPTAGDEIRFSTQIRPLLSDKCFQCHGPDEAKRAAGLRLDTETSAKQALESGDTAIVPGDVASSAIVELIPIGGCHLRKQESLCRTTRSH